MPKKKKKKVKRGTRSIVVGHLEKIGQKVVVGYRNVITELIKDHQGIYALYKNDRLYYVGLASNLRNRIKGHLSDRHQGKWTHFSIYILRKTDHLRETEALLLRIADPTGNYQKGKLKRSIDLRPELKRLLTDNIRKSLDELLGRKAKPVLKQKKVRKSKVERPLKGFFPTGKMIYASYQGKNYKAWVSSNGRIKYSGTRYDAPSTAGLAITKKSTLNGWAFWKYKDDSGNLVQLSKARK
jgi:hypothetical protein